MINEKMLEFLCLCKSLENISNTVQNKEPLELVSFNDNTYDLRKAANKATELMFELLEDYKVVDTPEKSD